MNEMERVLFKKLSERFSFFKLSENGDDFYIKIGDYNLDNIDYSTFNKSVDKMPFDIIIYSDDDIMDSYIELHLDENHKSSFKSRFGYNENFFRELYNNGVEIENNNYKKSAFLRKWRLEEMIDYDDVV